MLQSALKTSKTASWAATLLGAIMLLASCDDDRHSGGCWNCGPSTVAQVASAVVAGNFNDNGFASVIAAGAAQYQQQFNPGNLAIYLSTGAGTYAPPQATGAGDDPLYLASADLNGDKLPDVVSASYDDGTLTVFFNTTQNPGTFGAPLALSSPGASQVAIGDMNRDGLPDLVSADFNVSLFLQISPGVFANPVSLYPAGANWVAVGDLNGDGVADIALTDAVGVKVLLHTGAASSATYAAPAAVFTQTFNPNAAGANLIAIADVNGDGLNDLVITDPGPAGGGAPTVSVLLQNSAAPGTFLSPVSYPTAIGSFAQSIVVTDVNADGKPDIVIGGSTQVTVLLQNAASPGTFATAASYAVSNAGELAVADINGDGLVDIVVPNGPTQTMASGIISSTPGVLLQNSDSPGSFAAITALP